MRIVVEGQVDTLVTGNLRHFPKRARGPLRVESPSQFLERFVADK